MRIFDGRTAGTSRWVEACFLACGIALPWIYTLGRFQGWSALWPLPEGSDPAWVPGVLLVVVVATLLVFRRLPLRSPGARDGDARAGASLWPRLLVAVPAFGLLAWRLRPVGAPGDAETWLPLASDPFIMTSEPLGRWTHYLAYRVLALFGTPTEEGAVRFASVAAGCAYLAALVAWVPLLLGSVRRSIAWITYLFVSPPLVVFLGYPETTPWAYAFLGAFLLAGLVYLRGTRDRPPWWEGMILGLAIASHGCMCFAAGGWAVLLGTWWLRPGWRGAGWERASLAAALAFLPFLPLAAITAIAWFAGTGLATTGWISNQLGGPDLLLWIAWDRPRSSFQYAFLSARYARDIGNLLVAACPMLPAALLAGACLRGRRPLEAAFLSATLAGLLVLALFFNADLGIERDFDLLSPFAVPAYLLTALWLAEVSCPAGRGSRILFAIAFATLLLLVMPSLALA